MARCDEGYPCSICGQDVESILESDLYLQYVLGEVPLEALHRAAEHHISCNTALAQYIVDARFSEVRHAGVFDKNLLDHEYVHQREQQVTTAWRRLQAIPKLGLSIPEYPLHVTPPTPEELE